MKAKQCVFVVSCTCQVLLNMGFPLKKFGPSHGSSVEDSYVLIHHFLVGFKIVMSREAIGVNPAGGESNAMYNSMTLNTVMKGLTAG